MIGLVLKILVSLSTCKVLDPDDLLVTTGAELKDK